MNPRFSHDPVRVQASLLASELHLKQHRKYTGQPYFTHLERVANIVSWMTDATVDMVAAAYLHDSLEDQCPTPEIRQAVEARILSGCGHQVLDYVKALTNPSKQHTAMLRSERKQMDRNWLSIQSREVKRIKLVDRIDNLAETLFDSMTGYARDYDFQRTYLEESVALGQALRNADPALERKLMLVSHQLGEWLNLVEIGVVIP